VPTETLTTSERVAPEAVPEIVPNREDEALRTLALRHLERVRKFKLSLAVYVLSMLALTPVWIVTQYEQANGWPEHLSSRSRYAGDWDPWIIWAALIGAFVVAIFAVRAYFERASTEGEIEREMERLKSTR
jgi:NADH:ubiquinone oxidoreductase subunit 5 (subunit L)/multisubunit Na+/H+ antiporter MnhA subunit